MKENKAYSNGSRFQSIFPGSCHKLQNVDMGIAMAHFDLAAAELRFYGKWQVSEPNIDNENMRYIVSWVRDDIERKN